MILVDTSIWIDHLREGSPGLAKALENAWVLLHLPAYTPQLAPAETVVPLLREVAANRSFTDLDELETTLGQHCVYLLQHPELIQARANFHWLP